MKVINKNNMPTPFRLSEYKEYTIHRLVELEKTGRGSGKNNCSGYNLWKSGWNNMTVSEYQEMVKETCSTNDPQYSESKHLIYDIGHGWVELIPPTQQHISHHKKQALYLNGVYEVVLEEITKAQENDNDLVCYLQPYKAQAIKLLKKNTPSENTPTTLYISLTSSLNLVEYTAQVVGWDDKRDLVHNKVKLTALNKHITEHQPNEEEIYFYSDKEKSKPCVNLLSVKNLKKITNPFSVKNLIKVSDDSPYKPRTQSGGWSAVYEAPKWVEIENSAFIDKVESDLAEEISKSKKDSSEVRRQRLDSTPKKPEEIQIISRGFKRNPDVITEVLIRANGKCERCKSNAPFIRKKDNSPYLEVHHRITLADGGDDSVENAIAVCPNCHREIHFGL